MRRSILLLVFAMAAPAAEPDYRAIVVKFADTLLQLGRDSYGPRSTPVWMSVLDTQTFSAPSEAAKVPAPPGIRASDRAVGGANLYNDLVTIKVFDALSRLTGNPRYRLAVDEYLRFYFAGAQSAQTGLLGWGEHLYYDAFQDRVAIERRWHELLAWTPPWERLWGIDARATERAIAGLERHFFDERRFLFNRHGDYVSGQPPDPGKSQPWIKHSALYAYSFAFSYNKTGNQRRLDWARGAGSLYWNARNPETNLTEGCIGDPRPSSRLATPGGAGLLAYWLYKAGELLPGEPAFRQRALTLLKAYDRYGYDQAAGGYRSALHTNGKPSGSKIADPWDFAYGGEGAIVLFGRAAAYLAAKSGDKDAARVARRVEQMVHARPRPAEGDIGSLGHALNLSLDLYELTREPEYLAHARGFAREIVDKFWRGALFRSHTGYEYYEANLGVGDAVQGLLRLSLAGKRTNFDWSF